MDDDETTSGYSYQLGNTIYDMTDVAGAHNISSYGSIPVEDVTEDSKFVMQVDIYDFGTNGTSANFAIGAFATACTRIDWVDNSMMSVVLRPANGATNVQLVNGEAGTTPEYYVGGEKVEIDSYLVNGLGFQTDKLAAEKDKGRLYATYWFEFSIADKSLTIYTGYDDGAGNVEKTQCGTIKNALKVPTVTSSWLWQPACNIQFDNYKLYRIKGSSVDKTYITCDFESENSVTYDPQHTSKLIITTDGTARVGKFKMLDSLVRVTNPATDARIVSRNSLAVDNRLETTFEMSATYKLESFATDATRKVGIALGLKNYRTALSEPSGGASLIYLTVNEGNVVLGADNIAADGTATATGEQHVLGAAADLVGATAPYITLDLVGQSDGSVDVTVGDDKYNFPNIKANGCVALAQTGAGDVAYSVLDEGFNVTGYQLTLNEGGTVTSAFEGGWIPTSKFNVKNTIAPDAHVTPTENSHAVTGMVPENGKVGFYGSSTNTVLTFANPYADFVMQFDYISIPYKNRGVLGGIATGTSPNRFSPLYVVFGADEGISPLADFYAMGIVEGNATQYFWGAESLISPEGKLAAEGATLSVMTSLTDTEESETAIPKYGANPTEGGTPAFTVNGWGTPNDATKTFYNKTTRFKLVVINNNMALWAANVDENGAVVGEYRKVYEYKVRNSFGYVGLVGDSPTWCEIDNMAITPISEEVALEKGVDAVPAVDLVADIAVADMAADPEPELLARPALTADTAAKKVTWTAVEGAKEYEVTIRYNGTTKDTKVVIKPEVNMSDYEDEGDYTVLVVAIPEDEVNYQKSLTASVTYTVSANSGDNGKPSGGGSTTGDGNTTGDGSTTDDGNTETPAKKKCGSSVGATAGVAAIIMLMGATVLISRRKRA